jgi:MFS family permease
MSLSSGTPTIFHSLRLLKGNTRISVLVEPLWGIPFTLYNFYLSLYMKECGITDEQIGFLIGLGFITSIFFSLIGGMITDALGRKKTTLIFDFIAWPVSLLIYIFAWSFWTFALATVVNSVVRIVAISWNLMVVEDADPEQQVAAYNLLNAINIAVGVFTPAAGLMIHQMGVVPGERILLSFAVISMTTMILVRNHYYLETKVGRQILDEARDNPSQELFHINFYRNTLKVLKEKPLIRRVVYLTILFNTYIPIGTFSSLYFAPYLTEALKLDKSAISILGGVCSATMLAMFVFILPLISGGNRIRYMIAGIIIQICALGLLVAIPPGRFWLGIVVMVIFAVGFGIGKPFLDSLLAEVTTGRERTGIYAFQNTALSTMSALAGFTSGYLYKVHPALIYFFSIFILLACVGILIFLHSKQALEQKTLQC